MVREGYFDNKGEKFYRRTWIPECENLLANLVLIHGYGEHCARYDDFCNRLNQLGIKIFSFDQRGFGKSPGKRGWINNIEELLLDLDCFLNSISNEVASIPTFVMGHSMGGMVLARYVETRSNLPFKGLVFSSPFLAVNESVPKFLLKISGIIARVLPFLPVSKVDNTGLSKDPEAVRKADEDPLCYHRSVKAWTGHIFIEVINQIHSDMKKISLPLLILHGKKDSIVPYIGSVVLYQNVSSKDKTLELFEDGYHELWNDYEKDDFINKIGAWIKERAYH
ncbi:MAG: lysophospholipase [Candidatus Hydrogenedentes bacterium]|nr:lysophospholipase [Candidatus Hydrogenedentota bacterium]